MSYFRITTLAAAGIGLVLLASGTSSASIAKPTKPGPPAPAGSQQHATPLVTGGEKLKATFMTDGDTTINLTPGSFTPIGSPTTVRCTGATTCTIEADMQVQASGVGDTDAWGLCASIDGGSIFCPYIGYLADEFYTLDGYVEPFNAVTPGTHVFQPYLYSSAGGFLDGWWTDYRVYRP